MFLLKYFQPDEPMWLADPEIDQNETNQPQTTVNLDSSLLQKQKFYIRMIDSLKPEDDIELSSSDAESRYELVSKFYEKFISNQSEIATLVRDEEFDDQVNISMDIQRNVISLQKTFKENFSTTEGVRASVPEPGVIGNLNETERSDFFADFLESWYKKRTSLIKQIELIESKSNLDVSASEAEILFDHLSKFHESFNRNQTRIEAKVDSSELDGELEISSQIMEKVITVQTKLKAVFDPVIPPSPDFNESVVSLIAKQNSMMDFIKSIYLCKDIVESNASNCDPVVLDNFKRHVKSALKLMPECEKWFISNRNKIEEHAGNDVLDEQNVIFDQFQDRFVHLSEMFGELFSSEAFSRNVSGTGENFNESFQQFENVLVNGSNNSSDLEETQDRKAELLKKKKRKNTSKPKPRHLNNQNQNE